MTRGWRRLYRGPRTVVDLRDVRFGGCLVGDDCRFVTSTLKVTLATDRLTVVVIDQRVNDTEEVPATCACDLRLGDVLRLGLALDDAHSSACEEGPDVVRNLVQQVRIVIAHLRAHDEG